MIKKLLLLLFVSMLLGAGCIGSQQSKNEPTKLPSVHEISQAGQLAQQQMNLAGVENAQILEEGEVVVVSYNPSDVDYEGKIISDWGSIFGVLSQSYPSAKQFRIIQQLGGEKIATLTVNASDVKEYSQGRISIYEFKKRIAFSGGND
jgi:hypothetical protein